VATGTFAAGTTRDFPAGNGPTSIAVADYNQDGLADITVADETDNAVSILLNLGGGIFATNFELPVDKAPLSITTADFNGDDRPDVATANSSASDVTVLLNSASLFGSPLTSSSTPYPGVEYLDVGLKVKATPRIHPNNDVSLQLAFDISSISGQDFNAIPVINNETVEQSVRLKQNETAVLAGFHQVELMNAINGTPGVASLPGVQWLAQNQNLNDQSTDLLIFVTPRLVRLAPREDHVIYAGQGSIEGATVAGAAGGVPPTAAAPPTPAPAQRPVEPTPEPAQQQPPAEQPPAAQPPAPGLPPAQPGGPPAQAPVEPTPESPQQPPQEQAPVQQQPQSQPPQ
jgi:hypothetical protein